MARAQPTSTAGARCTAVSGRTAGVQDKVGAAPAVCWQHTLYNKGGTVGSSGCAVLHAFFAKRQHS